MVGLIIGIALQMMYTKYNNGQEAEEMDLNLLFIISHDLL
jgi:hypothetical protein